MDTPKEPLPLPASGLLGSLAMMTGMVGRIEDTEDMESKEAAFDEWLTGKWKAINAKDLKAGDRMRDAAGGEIEITGIYAAADDHIYATSKDRLGMHIPKRGIVLILPNARSAGAENNQPNETDANSTK